MDVHSAKVAERIAESNRPETVRAAAVLANAVEELETALLFMRPYKGNALYTEAAQACGVARRTLRNVRAALDGTLSEPAGLQPMRRAADDRTRNH